MSDHLSSDQAFPFLTVPFLRPERFLKQLRIGDPAWRNLDVAEVERILGQKPS